jgi:hypothetical protein
VWAPIRIQRLSANNLFLFTLIMSTTSPSDPLFEALAISSDAQSSPLVQPSSDSVKGEFDSLSALNLGVAVASGGG